MTRDQSTIFNLSQFNPARRIIYPNCAQNAGEGECDGEDDSVCRHRCEYNHHRQGEK